MPEPPWAATHLGRTEARARRTSWPRQAPLALLLATAVAAACAGTPQTAWETDGELVPGEPIREDPGLRGGGFSYRLESLDTKAEGILAELRVHNGASIGFRGLTLRLTLMGPQGESRSARVLTGPIPPRDSRRVSVHLPLPGFSVERLTVELISSLPSHGGYGKAADRRYEWGVFAPFTLPAERRGAN